MQDYAFPFHTCERVQKGSWCAQPWSALANAVCLAGLLLAVAMARTAAVTTLLLSFCAFEAMHLFSHVRHVEGQVQANVVHALGYCMAVSLLWVIAALGGGQPLNLWSVMAVSAVDIYIACSVRGLAMILSGLSVLVVVVFHNWHALSAGFRADLAHSLLPELLLLAALFVNEAVNGRRMLRFAPDVPWHLLVELVGTKLFWGLSVSVLRWESALV